jgi:plastocyanin
MKTALIVIIVLLLIGGGIYAFTSYNDGASSRACTLEAKLCPDGSYVGRVGPNCEFALCPGSSSVTSSNTNEATTSGIIKKITNASSTLSATTTVMLAKAITVTYTSSGFSPKTAIIAKGGTITFVNKSGEKMWVASDPHPTHNGYPGFDMGKYGDSWSFTFDKVGSWNYHNHTNPTIGGQIIVQ